MIKTKLKWKIVIYKRIPIEKGELKEKIFESEPMSFEEFTKITYVTMKPSMFGNKNFVVQGEAINVKEN